eukprot:TRINITY_DN49550_c0_g1_i1.p2 TRINITY_DN49550_c0_g1~~TRINITY_DN49550_c0_g1_i1.p2  ORF type:complete len:195 (+),score=32.69 TRINITY_DN49550_c0_g1_i1:127-711(+)
MSGGDHEDESPHLRRKHHDRSNMCVRRLKKSAGVLILFILLVAAITIMLMVEMFLFEEHEHVTPTPCDEHGAGHDCHEPTHEPIPTKTVVAVAEQEISVHPAVPLIIMFLLCAIIGVPWLLQCRSTGKRRGAAAEKQQQNEVEQRVQAMVTAAKMEERRKAEEQQTLLMMQKHNGPTLAKPGPLVLHDDGPSMV